MVHTQPTHFKMRMGWAGRKLTDSGTGKGGSEAESLDNGTCLESLLACGSSRWDLKIRMTILEDLGDAGGNT